MIAYLIVNENLLPIINLQALLNFICIEIERVSPNHTTIFKMGPYVSIMKQHSVL